MNDPLREHVSQTYTAAVRNGSGCCGGTPAAKAERIGYTRDDLTALPDDAVVNSFGCGNPLAFSEVRAGEVVLDLGSGAGIDLLIAARKTGPTGHVIGVDMTDEMLDRARRNIAAAGVTNAEVRKGIIENLPVADGSADWVISNCVINLSPEKPRVFAEMHRVLKPGGRFAISDIVVDDMPDWIAQHIALYSACISGAISEAEYLRGLRDAGFEALEITGRVVYDAGQIRALIDSGQVPLPADLPRAFVDRAIAALADRIQSIKVQGRKQPCAATCDP